MNPLRTAIVGAQSTGKTWLILQLAGVLRARGQTVLTLDEVHRIGCSHSNKTRQYDAQLAIALDQAQVIQQATQQAPASWLLSDTTPLMTAVYSHLLFEDTSLYPMALAHHALYDITLVTGLDLPGVAVGLQGDGPQLRAAVDTLVRQALDQAGMAYRVVYGQRQGRLNNALLALGLPGEDFSAQKVRDLGQFAINQGRGIWQCNECSDPACEKKLFTALLKQRSAS